MLLPSKSLNAHLLHFFKHNETEKMIIYTWILNSILSIHFLHYVSSNLVLLDMYEPRDVQENAKLQKEWLK